SYVVADTEQKEYKVMPGGLSRSSPKKGVFIVSNQSGGISKDTWVLGNKQDAIKHVSNKDLTVQRSVKIALPSRTGEHLFWLGRYMERSTFTVRLLRIVLLTYNESDKNIHEQEDEVLSTLLKSLTALTGTLPGFTEDKLLKKPETELLALALDLTKTGSLAHSIQSMLSNSYAVRDRLSLDTWRILDSISEETLNMRKYASNLTQIYRGLDSLIVKLMAFYGLNIDNMTREVTWHLLNTGRFIESAINNCTIILSLLTKKLDTESDKSLMEDVLRCNESLVTYRYHYRSNLEISGVLSLLILNEENPRSVLYQILKIQYHSDGLPQAENEEGLSEIQKKLLEATTKIRLCDLEKMVATVGDENEYDQLIVFLTEIISLLKDSSYLIFEQYFSHTQNRYSMIQTDLLPEI
ncbi:MAG: putative alpha-E superfamily protein, partial [Cyclobacteriaceae bacterium]